MAPELKHCATCTCGERKIVLPPDYLPEGFSFELVGNEMIITDPEGNYNYYWTHRFNRETEGYTSVEFRESA